MQPSRSFRSLVRRIELAYERLGHELGWRFLYTPARTLSADTRLALVGTNPGGNHYVDPAPSVEEGNAYRVERWPGAGPSGLNPLQEQIALLYKALASKLGRTSRARLMDETLAANFCPFRSASWESLASREQSIDFSRELWSDIVDLVRPSAVICIGDAPARELARMLENHGWSLGRREAGPVGWGAVGYSLEDYESSGRRTLLLRLPHLSRYRIFGRSASRVACDRVMSLVAAAMSGGGDPLPGPPCRGRLDEGSAEAASDTDAVTERATGRSPSPIARERSRGRRAAHLSHGLGASAAKLLGRASYSITDRRAHEFLLMLGHIPGLRRELDARDLWRLREMVSPGGRVEGDLSKQFAKPIAHYARTAGYNQVNWLRGAIAVYVVDAERRRPGPDG